MAAPSSDFRGERVQIKPVREIVAGTRGVLWVLFADECYGVEAYVMMAMDDQHRLTLQTATPLDMAIFGSTAWALLVDGEVMGSGPR